MEKLNRKKGFTLVESLIALSVLGLALAGGMKGTQKVNQYISQKAMTKDITTILRAVDTRVSIDGYSYGFWPNDNEVTGLPEIAPFIQQAFISRNNAECGQADGWQPQLDTELDRNFVSCDFWQTKLPFNSAMTIRTFETSEGFLGSFDIEIDLPVVNATNSEELRNRFDSLKSIRTSLLEQDYANRNGINAFEFESLSSGQQLSNAQCVVAGLDCILSASWNKQGFDQPLITDSSNAMVSSSVSFMVDKKDADELSQNCVIWEESSPNNWTSTIQDCGLGLYSIDGTATPTTVHLNINEATAVNRIVLDRLCNQYERDSGSGVKISGQRPCGLMDEFNDRFDNTQPSGAGNNTRKVVQYIGELNTTVETANPAIPGENIPNFLVDDLFAEDIVNVQVVKVAGDLFNKLSSSVAEFGGNYDALANPNIELLVQEEAFLKATTNFLKDLEIGLAPDPAAVPPFTGTPVTTTSLEVKQALETYGAFFRVKEDAVLNNVSVNDGGATPQPESVNVLRSFKDPAKPFSFDLKTDYFLAKGTAVRGDQCFDKAAFTVDRVSNVVLTCRESQANPNVLTWESNYYGEVAAFDGTCPSGWSEIEDVHSRVLMTSGSYKEDLMPTITYESRDIGGEAFVSLTPEQMAEHEHATPKFEHICDTCHRWVPEEECPPPFTWYEFESRCVWSQGMSHTRDGSSVFSNDSNRISTFVGGGKSHNNQQNFVSVTYCVYGEGDGQTPDMTPPPPDQPNWVPYDSEISGWLDDVDKKFYNCGTSVRDYSPAEGIWYTKTPCKLDQYQLEKGREIDLNSGNIRYSGVDTKTWRTISETQIWKELPLEYEEWVDIGQPYNCSPERKYYDPVKDDYYKVKDCDTDQERLVYRWEQDIRFEDKRLMPEVDGVTNPYKEYQTINKEYRRLVAGGGFDDVEPEDLEIVEGDFGEQKKMRLKIKLNKPFSEDLVYRVNTQDITTTSILSETEELIYDQFGNPFISVVDNQNGGRLMFDGGFPKYYNTYWNGADEFDELRGQFIFMHNVIKWMSETHKDRGKVLIYGDRSSTASYHVKGTNTSGFKTSLSGVVKVAGFKPVIKDYTNFGGSYASRPASISLDEMNKYSSIIVMSSGGWNSLDNETANSFTTYVNNGGGVYIITDHDWFQPTGNQILQKFGSQFYGVVNRTPSHSAYKLSTIWNRLSGSKYGRSHQLWKGLSSSDSIHAGGSEGNVRLFTPVQDLEGFTQDILFRAGETEKFIEITINGDDLREEDETFKIILSNPDSGVVVGNSELIATILDDDSGVKSLSISCGLGVQDHDGTCVTVKSSPITQKWTEVDSVEETVKGDLRIRYDENGNMDVMTNIGDFSMSAQCNGESVQDLIRNNSKSSSETGDTLVEAEIYNLRVLNQSMWKSSQTYKASFQDNQNICQNAKKGFDANVKVEATLKTKKFELAADCDGVVKDGICTTKEYHAPKTFCLQGYHQVDNLCIKN